MTAYGASISRGEPKEKTLEEKVQGLKDQGCSFAEVQMSFPLVSTKKLQAAWDSLQANETDQDE